MGKKIIFFAMGSAALAGFSLATHAPPAAEMAAGLAFGLPEKVPGWSSVPMEISEPEKRILPPDTKLTKRRYRTGGPGEEIQATIVLSGKDRTSIHRPEVCLAGQGWNLEGREERAIPLTNGEALRVSRLSVSRETENGEGRRREIRAYFVYWFVGSRTTTPDNLSRILSTARDNVLRGENPRWAYVSLISPVGADVAPGGLDAELTWGKVAQWVAEAAPEFQRVFEPAGLF